MKTLVLSLTLTLVCTFTLTVQAHQLLLPGDPALVLIKKISDLDAQASVYPNPFNERFLVMVNRPVDKLILASMEGESVGISYQDTPRGIMVMVPKAESGDYMLYITYSDGSQEKVHIVKL